MKVRVAALVSMIAVVLGTPAMAFRDTGGDSGYTTTTHKETTSSDYSTSSSHPTTSKPSHGSSTTSEHHTTTTKPRHTTTTEHTTTTTKPETSSTSSTTAPSTTTSTTSPTTSSTSSIPTGQFGINVSAVCTDDFLAAISITFPNRPDLDGDIGILDFSDGTSYGPLVFQSNTTTVIPYPASNASPLTLTYRIMGETATATVTYPTDLRCNLGTTTTLASTTTSSTTSEVTTSTTLPPTSVVTTTTSSPPTTTTSSSTSTTTSTSTTPSTTTSSTAPPTSSLPPTFEFGAALSVCVAEVPTIRIEFQNLFPDLAGQTGTLTMRDINGNVVSTQPLVYQPGATVDLLYPGTSVNPDGSIDDVPGWILTDDGFWIRDPSDEFLRDGINLSYTVNPTATAFVTYPPESSACANPENPPRPPGTTVPGRPPTGQLPPTL